MQWDIYDGGCWFRVFGYGLRVVDRSKHPPLWSERNGRRRVLQVGRYSISLLVR